VGGIFYIIFRFFVWKATLSGSCHQKKVRPGVVYGGDGLWIWRVAVNILNKQLQRAIKGMSLSLGVGWRGLTSPNYKKAECYEMLCRAYGVLLWTQKWTFRFHERWEISSLAERVLASQEELCSMELDEPLLWQAEGTYSLTMII